jgi:nicotinate-nucleotide pyrophosphorylase
MVDKKQTNKLAYTTKKTVNPLHFVNKGAVIIYGGGWHRREKGWINKILSE